MSMKLEGLGIENFWVGQQTSEASNPIQFTVQSTQCRKIKQLVYYYKGFYINNHLWYS